MFLGHRKGEKEQIQERREGGSYCEMLEEKGIFFKKNRNAHSSLNHTFEFNGMGLTIRTT